MKPGLYQAVIDPSSFIVGRNIEIKEGMILRSYSQLCGETDDFKTEVVSVGWRGHSS